MPNWKEAFEQVLAKGCVVACTPANCMFCVVANKARLPGNEPCSICPLHWDGLRDCGGPWEELDGSLRRAIFRYVLKTVQDFTDRDEIRARIAEMLDDDAREKFLGKAKRKEYTVDTGVYIYHYEDKVAGNALRAPNGVTPLRYLIRRAGCFTAAFRDEDTRDRVLAFLNGEAK